MAARIRPYGSYLLLALVPPGLYLLPPFGRTFRLSSDLLGFLSYLPYPVFLVVGYLGLRLNQTRVFWAALLLLAGYGSLENPDLLRPLGAGEIRLPQILSVSFPLAFASVFLFPESPLRSERTFNRLFWALFPFLCLVALLKLNPSSFSKLFDGVHFLPFQTRLPDVAAVAVGIYGVVALLSGDSKSRLFRVALFLTLLPMLFAFHVAVDRALHPEVRDTYFLVAFAAAAAMAFHAIFHLYWQRVYLDELTEIPNRRALDEKLAHLSPPYAIIMADVDHFKRFNDTYGHDEGDNVLRMVARHLDEASAGRAYRYGGEEFCVLYEGLDAAKAAPFAEDLRRGLVRRRFYRRHANPRRKRTSKEDRGKGEGKGRPLRITISLGVASPDKNHRTPGEVQKWADQALYEAKRLGRNRVQVAE